LVPGLQLRNFALSKIANTEASNGNA
jgi:hypothetical protein